MVSMERVKACGSCRCLGRADSDAYGESDFWSARREGGRVVRWQTYCKACNRVKVKERRDANAEAYRARARARHAERMRTDPEYHARHNEICRRASERWLAKPENVRKARESHKAWHARMMEKDPEGMRAYQREAYAVKRERLGKPVRPQRRARDTPALLPVEPFFEWLVEYRRIRGGALLSALARELDVEERRIRGVLGREGRRVSLDVVDRALIHAEPIVVGGRLVVTLNDLYPYEEG